MVGPSRDPIAFVEACYDLSVADEAWLRGLADAALPLMRARTVLAYHLDIDDRGLYVRGAAQAGDGHGDVAGRIRGLGELYDRRRAGEAGPLDTLKTKLFEKSVHAHLAEPADRMLLSEMHTYGPRWTYTLGAPGVRELLFMINHHIDGHGATYVVGALAKRGQLQPAARMMFQRLGAHVKAGKRLRRRLAGLPRSLEAPEHGAVLDASARVVHADGEACTAGVRALLEQHAQAIDRARTQRVGRDEDALAVWQGLIEGRWSLVERFDSDGKRFLVAHQNPEGVLDPRGLSALEARVVGLGLRGYSDKLIGYHLGLAESTVSSHLGRALRKLGVTGRVELVRTFGRARA